MYDADLARDVQARRPVTVRIGWLVVAFLALVAAQWQGWIDLPAWVFWLLGVPLALLVLFVAAAFTLHRILMRRFRRLFQDASEQMRAWQRRPGAEDDVVEGEVVEDEEPSVDPDDPPVRIPVQDGDE